MGLQNMVLGLLRNLPAGMKRRLAGAPLEIDGHVLDANLQIMANMAAKQAGDPPDTVEGFREAANAFDPMGLPRRRGVSIEDTVIDGPGGPMKARIYCPKQTTDADPAVLFFHQGGLVVMHHLTDDHFCSVLADECGAKVISLDYRLCPEAPFPAPIEDALALYDHVQANGEAMGIDVRRVALAGDSAGGLIAATLTQILRDRKEKRPPAAQLLAYPWVATDMPEEGSMLSCAECFPLNSATMDFFNATVFPGDKGKDHPYANPLLNDNLTGLPPAVIGTAGFDPIRDQGDDYAERLQAAGNQVTHYCFSSLTHSYLVMGRVSDAAERASVQLARDLAKLLGR